MLTSAKYSPNCGKEKNRILPGPQNLPWKTVGKLWATTNFFCIHYRAHVGLVGAHSMEQNGTVAL